MTQIKARRLSKFENEVHQALKLWHNTNSEANPLGSLHLFQRARRQGAGSIRQATNEILLEALKVLEEEHGQDADLLRMRFLDGLVMHAAANHLNLAESTANRKQRQAIRYLAEIIRLQEDRARGERQALLERRLDLPPETCLIGVEHYLSDLLTLLKAAGPPWLVSVEGLGGIGKTSLANALIRQIALDSRFYDIAWVSAKQQEFLPGTGLQQADRPALDVDTLRDALLEQLGEATALTRPPQEKMAVLTGLLKTVPYLVVVDNLETALDYQTLLPVLRKLANPSKFLLTSRHSLRAHADVSCLGLEELNRPATFTFLRYEAEVRRLLALAGASESQLDSIYQVVGGNPLALKLVVGQIGALPLTQVLENLKLARGKKIDELYTYIYWQAWQALAGPGRQVFLSMPLVQNGTIAQLAAVSELEPEALNAALEQLVTLSLIEIGGNLEERRYRIHHLTETFLLTEVARWQLSP